MHKLVLKIFKFTRNSLHFCKIVDLFLIILILIYWIKNLAKHNWQWLDFANPFFDSIIGFCGTITEASINLCGANYEYKYFIAIAIMIVIYYALSKISDSTLIIEDKYDDIRRVVKKNLENDFNVDLEKKNLKNFEKNTQYKIYLSARVKSKLEKTVNNAVVNEKIKEAKQYIINNTHATPINYGEGFLFSYSDFNKIDDVIKVYLNLIENDSTLKYTICVQTYDSTQSFDINSLKDLICLNIENKITMLLNVAYKYKFNTNKNYAIKPIGLYSKNNTNYDVYEFTKD